MTAFRLTAIVAMWVIQSLTMAYGFIISSTSTKHMQMQRLPNVLPVGKGRSSASVHSSSLQNEGTQIQLPDDPAKDESISPQPSSSETFDWARQWYPALPLTYIDQSTTPIPFKILGRDLLVWKTADGRFSVLDDSCPHRRAPLSTGKIVNERTSLACRYHGWEFNADGACQKIPMMKPGQSTNSKAFCVTSYPFQLHDGLLWIYLDPTDPSPPTDLPIASIVDQNEKMSSTWFVDVTPISYLSLIENSFDPSHAPFTHEGRGSFSPLHAIPMDKYELVEDGISPKGFKLEHTPYQRDAKTPPGGPLMMTTRQFVPPATNVVKSPFFSTVLHFVPADPNDTMVLGKTFSPLPKTGVVGNLAQLKPLVDRMADWFHFQWRLSEAHCRFESQDRMTMQGQDSRKIRQMKWKDHTPTKSDAGVVAMQKWMKLYGTSGPFPMQSMTPQEGRQPSIWDRHARFCPQCKRAIQRMSKLAKLSSRASKLSLGCSGVGAASSILIPSKRLSLLAASMIFIVVSVGMRQWTQYSYHTLEKVFASGGNLPEQQLMEIYPS